jgi:hypothetical protein
MHRLSTLPKFGLSEVSQPYQLSLALFPGPFTKDFLIKQRNSQLLSSITHPGFGGLFATAIFSKQRPKMAQVADAVGYGATLLFFSLLIVFEMWHFTTHFTSSFPIFKNKSKLFCTGTRPALGDICIGL